MADDAICCIFALQDDPDLAGHAVQGANDLVMPLRAGLLPARLTIVEESPMAAPK
ncbi:hypothetical protein [Mesorhizobium mediterraneum]|uniref:hypothetical protein n=1 Tax=Mesorhizobium mediterraneum TaxID=43617 RepID=UPI00177FE678|nr:hypothetical protein [Mesorhizobium mediterraneum]